MFGLITKSRHEDEMLDMQNLVVCGRKKNDALEKRGRVLAERIRLGEEYRARLELEIASVKETNIRLLREKDELERELSQRMHELREARLMCGSLEAHLSARHEREEVNEA